MRWHGVGSGWGKRAWSPSSGSSQSAASAYCQGVAGKDVLKEDRKLQEAGWACSGCGAAGNYPHRRQCRICGQDPPPQWITAQQRAVAKKRAAGGPGAKPKADTTLQGHDKRPATRVEKCLDVLQPLKDIGASGASVEAVQKELETAKAERQAAKPASARRHEATARVDKQRKTPG